jgi:hypothetical protein
MAKYEKVVPFVTEPPIIEISAGVVYVRSRSGDNRSEYTMSIKTFAASFERSKRALDRFARGEQHILED